jgi:regulator of protease activity HflC (stomatin/prohibitin superfamily)
MASMASVIKINSVLALRGACDIRFSVREGFPIDNRKLKRYRSPVEILIGLVIYFVIRCIFSGFYAIDQNERAVKTVFGRARRYQGQRTITQPIAANLNEEEKQRYNFPVVRVIGPGLHFKFPWEKIYKASVATVTVNMAIDPEDAKANKGGTVLEAVTQDQLNIGLTGQIRFKVEEHNLYAYFFGIREPILHVMGYFISVLREKIANYEGPKLPSDPAAVLSLSDTYITDTVSINDLRKNLREINDSMLEECRTSAARYGIVLEASLITGMAPPHEVESALAAINTAYNNVSSEISLAKAGADQTIVLSRRAVEIETLKVQAEVEPLIALAKQLAKLRELGPAVLQTFVRNVKMEMYEKATRVILER